MGGWESFTLGPACPSGCILALVTEPKHQKGTKSRAHGQGARACLEVPVLSIILHRPMNRGGGGVSANQGKTIVDYTLGYLVGVLGCDGESKSSDNLKWPVHNPSGIC